VAPLLVALGVARLIEQREKPNLSRALLLMASVLCFAVVFLAWYGSKRPGAAEIPLVSNALGRIVLLGALMGATILLLRTTDRRREIVCTLGLLALLWLDYRTHTPRLNPTVTPDVFQAGLMREYLKLPDPPLHGRGRIMPSFESMGDLQHRTVASAHDECLGRRVSFSGNLNLLDAFSKTEGFFPLYPRETWEFNQMLYLEAQSSLAPLKDFICATYISSPSNYMEWTRRESAMPMITSGQRPVFASRSDTAAAMLSPTFNPKATVYLPLEAASIVPTNPGSARIIEQNFAAHRVSIDVEASGPSLVTIAQSYYHRWQATVDGVAAPLLRANHAFQAVLVPAGTHRIILSYRDAMFHIGSIISLVALAGCAGFLLLSRRSE
jgi:hypothetical protein